MAVAQAEAGREDREPEAINQGIDSIRQVAPCTRTAERGEAGSTVPGVGDELSDVGIALDIEFQGRQRRQPREERLPDPA